MRHNINLDELQGKLSGVRNMDELVMDTEGGNDQSIPNW